MDDYGPISGSMTTDVKEAICKLVRHLDAIGEMKVQKVCQKSFYIYDNYFNTIIILINDFHYL